ncbi:MAG: hypothetical protein KatS3mg042_1648 [Rhodothermaceae bacterium]|nr:MAG: hypothetical protein KatS3mg042_1648 [Rhodothermaceae bacterium]
MKRMLRSLLIGLMVLAAGIVPARAQVADTTAVRPVPAPSGGTAGVDTTAVPPADRPVAPLPSSVRTPQPVRVQVGSAGGVRIRSLNISRPRLLLVRVPRAALARAATPTTPATPAGTPGLTAQDLQQLEDRLIRYLDARLAQWAAVQGRPSAGAPPVVVVPPATTVPPATVTPPPAPVTPPGQEPPPRPDVTPPAVIVPPAPTPAPVNPAELPRAEITVEQITRALLEEGLFRALSVHFEVDQSTLLPSSRQTLDALGTVLTRHPELRLEIAGHTDSTGPDDYNLRLSQARAEAVRAYLIERFGIAPERLVARGYGESQPIADNVTATGRTLNRRVEFRVIE